MRIWSIHPQYLDAKGIVALWRETLLAQNVLQGKTKGYKNHPQLNRFKDSSKPLQYLVNYLHLVCDDADNRNYNFNRTKLVLPYSDLEKITVTTGQMDYEWKHFLRKVEVRDNDLYQKLKLLKNIKTHPIFTVIEGEIEDWEIL